MTAPENPLEKLFLKKLKKGVDAGVSDLIVYTPRTSTGQDATKVRNCLMERGTAAAAPCADEDDL